MSELFAETNNEPLVGLFNKRAYYKLLNGADLTNFGAEKYLYGRVDREFKPVYTYSGYSFNFKSIERKARNNEDHRALNFVVDAFNDLAQQFAKCLQIGQIDGNLPYLTNLRVYRSYQDPIKAYNNYINSYTNIFASKNRDVEKFEDIQPKIDAALKVSSKSSPFTFPAFVKNRRTPITITGLAIEIADVNAANDNAKMELFANSLNWEFYLTAARSFGFMVDLDVPWRLVADIGSSVMLRISIFWSTQKECIKCIIVQSQRKFNSHKNAQMERHTCEQEDQKITEHLKTLETILILTIF